MIYVYALTDSPSALSPEVCVADGPIELFGGPRVFAAGHRTDRASVPPTPENLWRHEEIVESLMTDRTVLPARFGTLIRDEAELRSLLSRAEPEIAAGLERVRGMVEIGVRVRLRSTSDGNAEGDAAIRPPGEKGSVEARTTGRDYMRSRGAAEQRRREREERLKGLAAELHARLVTAAREHTSHVLAAPALVSSAAYLVPRGEVESFRQRVEQFADDEDRVEVLCTGPWPAYHFVPDLGPRELWRG